MIEIKDLNKIYENGYEALKDIDLKIPDGALVTLLGPSGCGKSTVLNIIAGILDPTHGDILFDDKSVINLHPKDRNIGMVFQNYALYPHMTVLENITFPLTVGDNKIKRSEANKVAQRYMDLTYITDYKDKKPNQLSGGQQQRVAIARALVQNPKILLMDEPLSNLDARLRLSIREEIRDIVKDVGVTTIFVTHDQEEALSISDYIALIDDGVIQQYDIPQNLYLEPANLFVAKFIGNPIINIYEMRKIENSLVSDDFSISLDDFDKNRFKEMLDKDKYLIGIRPEHFKLADSGIIVRVENIEMIGRYMILHFTLDGVASRVIADSKLKINKNDKVSLTIDYSSIYLFEEDGKRVY
ncbi:MAG: ABC transporter ATP-binding protein [Anaerococcus sp.]|uniref:ABC transporter ATP-binding protein n=2 Tax=Peptoniphilaceae TaxID=1570339 RepID=UPI001AE8B0D4|nr:MULTISPECIES: ABC transporter ATP-binding protein [Anaerococcus]MBP2070121.1 multiple sugar transport system ATP-binding protein [Anaerococcus nagyae]MDU1864985.1 ABC transporter ATP-binding protein [Anaerococcus sp.]MDU2353182.1 ABC transporter ATP-binding protein [Anaerococcus sp.]